MHLTKQAKVTYLCNSGFAVELEESVLVFDYYQDPAGKLPALLGKERSVYFFVSHAHFDHFSPAIGNFADTVKCYFLSTDIRSAAGCEKIPAEKAVYLRTYDGYQDEAINVTTYSSTDEGTSFLVELNGWRIFHAGDFNWWHWKGDTAENIALAKNGFMKQMKRLAGLQADLAFFPVDKRMEEFASLGAKEFCRRSVVNYLITMHNMTDKPWERESDFFVPGQEIPVWSPMQPGEIKTIEK